MQKSQIKSLSVLILTISIILLSTDYVYATSHLTQEAPDVKTADEAMERMEEIFEGAGQQMEEVEEGHEAVMGGSETGGCLIATATYGSELAPQVQLLREIRDNTVFATHSGTSFMSAFNTFYYSFSPLVADFERQNPVFKETVKIAITPLITTLSMLQYVDIDSESEMLGYGIGIILLNIGVYFVAPAVIVYKIQNRK